jgi:Zn-dependent peptidase ImmA (M78 family)
MDVSINLLVLDLVKKYGTNSPYEIAERINITILKEPLGSTLGYHNTYKRIQFIHLNGGLSESMRRFVCAHELGHAVLHPKINTPFLRKNTLFSVNRFEKEANQFAIELLLTEMEAQPGETIEQIFAENDIPFEMVHYF